MFIYTNELKTAGPAGNGRRFFTCCFICLVLILYSFNGTHAPAQIDASGVNTDKNIARAYKTSQGVELKRGPKELDANDPYLVFTENNSSLTLQVRCHPTKLTYLTVKVWGGSGGGTLQMTPTGLPNRPLTKQRQSEPYPGRFYYATKYIDREATKENNSVEVTLTYTGGTPGLEIYEVYTHTQPMFRPSEDELQGKPFKLGSVKPAEGSPPKPKETFDHFSTMADDKLEAVLDTQIYGEKWEPYLTEEGGMADDEIPAFIRGGFLTRWGSVSPEKVASYDDPVHKNHRKKGPEDNDWIVHGNWEDVYSKYGSFMIWQADRRGDIANFSGPMLAMARAYNAEWSKYHQSEELLKRFAAAMDVLAIAQGTSGRFGGPWRTWIGAPNRSDYFSDKWQSGQEALYKAYRKMHDALEQHGLLKKPIDHDQRPGTPAVPRRKAYADMAVRSFDFVAENLDVRSITNQYYLSLHPLYPVVTTLNQLAPERLDRKRVRELYKTAIGLRRGQGGNLMFSDKGLSQEHGYSANYGDGNPNSIGKLAVEAMWAGHDLADTIRERAHRAYRAYAHFLYLGNGPDGYRQWNRVEWITSRAFNGIPGSMKYFRNKKVLENLDIPPAERSYAQMLEHNRKFRTPELFDPEKRQGKTPWNAFIAAWNWAGRAKSAMKRDGWDRKVSTAYRLPDEREGPTAFADEHILAAALRYEDERLFVNLIDPRRAILIHQAPKYNRLAQVAYRDKGPKVGGNWQSKRGGAVKWMQYGPYLIALNAADKEFTYPVPERMAGKQAIDLKRKRTGRLPRKQSIPAHSSHTFVVPALR